MVFKKIIFQNRYVALETPSRPLPPFMANAILNFHFDFLTPSLSENANPYQQGRARICKVCGKEGSWSDIKNHIEANHIAGISIPCGLCGKVSKTRNALIKHKSRHHRNQ